jgi:hypothetical protein
MKQDLRQFKAGGVARFFVLACRFEVPGRFDMTQRLDS